MPHELTQRVFAAVDTMKPDALTEFITEDARVVFGNAHPLVGREAITAGLEAFYSSIKGLRHRIVNQWCVGADTVVETEVSYHRLDDRSVCVPVVSIWHAREGGLIDDYRVYFDLTPVYTP
jgi:ketosteroid isomerase-like protein